MFIHFALTLHSSELFVGIICWALYPRLAVLVCLHLIPNGLLLAAPQCGSWVVASRGTSRRSLINPRGYEGFDFVAQGNQLVARFLAGPIQLEKWLLTTVNTSSHPSQRLPRLFLLLMVAVANSCIFVVENPSHTLLWAHERFSYFCNWVVWAPRLPFHGWKYLCCFLRSLPYNSLGIYKKLLDVLTWKQNAKEDNSNVQFKIR